MARVGIDARYLETENTGIGRYTLNLLTGLLALDRENAYWVFLRREYAGPLPCGRNVTYLRLPYPPISLSTLVSLSWQIRRLKLDLWHAHFPVTPLFAGVPVLVTVHDLQPLRVQSLAGSRPWPLRIAYRVFYPLAYWASLTFCRRIVAVSASACRELQEVLSVPREKIQVIHEALDDGLRGRAAAPADGEVPADRPELPERFLLCVGPTLPHKNLGILLEGFAAVLAQPGGDGLFLVLAGRRSRFEGLWQRRAAELGITDRVLRMGYVSPGTLARLYARALALVHVARYEGFGFPPLEAMWHSLPVIAAFHASLPEVVGSGAVLVDPDDAQGLARAILRVLHNQTLRRRLARCGRLNLERFQWTEAARKTLGLYEQTLASR